jgi:hypothetical protein
MKHIVIVALAISLSAAVMAGEPATPAALSVEQIVAKNIEARGGVDAWHKIRTMVWVGHVETANAPAARIPFMLEQKFPNKTRFEIRGQNQMSLRMFDGVNGWKLRPAANGTPQLEPFTSSELSFAHDGQGIEGPLIDYAAKGIAVTLGGIDELEGQPAYRLDLRLPSGASHHLWLDAQTFLERRYDRPAVNAGGRPATVSVVYADYRSWEGVQIPLRIETGSDSTKTPDRMVIDRLALNPPLGDALFAKPQVAAQATRGVSVDTRSAVHAQAAAGQAMPGR